MLVSTAKLAKFLNLTTRRIRQLVDEGMPRKDKGEYDPAVCMMWYIRYLQKAIANRDGAGPDAAELRAQRTRLITAQAKREELDLAREEGRLVPIADYEESMAAHITIARQHLLSLPAGIAHELEGEDRETIKRKLDNEIRKVLTSLAERKD